MPKYSVQETTTIVKHYIAEGEDPDSAVWACREGGSGNENYADPVTTTFEENTHWSAVEVVEVDPHELAERAND